jgi:8-oxo-dGTP pyrophosphatase MutT (NUDIX family)
MHESMIVQAATILLLREGASAPEVYMTKRPETMAFLADHYVFPGGKMDEEDGDARLLARCEPLEGFQNPEGLSLMYWVTAIREAFEEVGVLLARDRTGKFVSQERLREERKAMLSGEVSFRELVEGLDLRLATDRMRYFGHRLTPRKVSPKRRFDTRYFLTMLPEGMVPEPYDGEVAAAGWFDAATALSGWERGKMRMVPPTVDCLRTIGRFSRLQDIWLSTAGVGTPTAEELA